MNQPYMRIYDAERAKAYAAHLRNLADKIDREEVKYVACFAMHTVEGARKHGYAFEEHADFIETVGVGEYALVLGALRDFYLDVEDTLRDRARLTAENLSEPKEENQ